MVIMEPEIVINGHRLLSAQAMTIRVAIETFAVALGEGLGDDNHGRSLSKLYMKRIEEIRRYMYKTTKEEVT